MTNRTMRDGVHIAVIALATSGLVVSLWADKTYSLNSDLDAIPTKTLHFPKDQCMGRLYVEDPCLGSEYLEGGRDLSLPLGLNPKLMDMRGDWDFVGLAQGDVVVPAGRNIRLITILQPRREDFARLPMGLRMYLRNRFSSDPNDLSGLSGLGPNDLYKLDVDSIIVRADADWIRFRLAASYI
jgi:hypothetical protein